MICAILANMLYQLKYFTISSIFLTFLGTTVTVFAPTSYAWELELSSADLPVVDCQLDKPRKCLLDTGSRYGFVLKTFIDTSQQLSDSIQFIGDKIIHGVNGGHGYQVFRLQQAKAGSLVFNQQEILSPLKEQPGTEDLPFSADLGLPILSPKFHIQTSFLTGKVQSFERLPENLTTFPLEITPTGHLIVEVEFHGHIYKAIVDTGSSVSVIGRRFVEQNSELLKDSKEFQEVKYFSNQTLTVGNMKISASDLFFYDTDSYEDVVSSISPEVDMILGWPQIAMSFSGYTHTKWWFDLERKIWSNKGEIIRGGRMRRGQ